MTEINFAQITLWTVLTVYAAGVATSLTPCVYPIVPIVVGYLGNQSGNRQQRIIASLSYLVGLSLIYALLGILAAATGEMFGSLTTNSTVYLIFGILLLALSGSLLDFYQLPIPSFLQPKASGRRSGGYFWQPLLVGASSGIVASPCTAPVMGTLLFYIASTHQMVKGASLMLIYALGMNTILVLLGFSAGWLRHLPKSGRWMEMIKKCLAILVLASGIYFIFQAGRLS